MVDPAPEAQRRVDQPGDDLARQKVRLQTQLQKCRVLRVVMVHLLFDARISDPLDGYAEPQSLAFLEHHLGQISHRKLLGELIEEAVLAWSWRSVGGKLNTSHGSPNVQKTARLSAFA